MAYLCLRAMEMRVCGYPTVQRVAFDVEVTDLFFGYRSPWRA
jgi:hypothetical protein